MKIIGIGPKEIHFGVFSCKHLHKALIEPSESNECLSVVGDRSRSRGGVTNAGR
jgi:hypothetical protein